MPGHLFGINDLIEPLLIDVAGQKRGLLNARSSSFALCAISEALSHPMTGLKAATNISERPEHFVDAFTVELRAFNREAPKLVTDMADEPGRMKLYSPGSTLPPPPAIVASRDGSGHSTEVTDACQ